MTKDNRTLLIRPTGLLVRRGTHSFVRLVDQTRQSFNWIVGLLPSITAEPDNETGYNEAIGSISWIRLVECVLGAHGSNPLIDLHTWLAWLWQMIVICTYPLSIGPFVRRLLALRRVGWLVVLSCGRSLDLCCWCCVQSGLREFVSRCQILSV